MCSIAYGDEVGKMLQKMKHRAPDDEGIVGNLGMGRLSIIDLKSDGLCPFTEDGDVLAFNGEIYNYKELRSELRGLSHTFRTESDTEVLYHAYKQWGMEGCLQKLNGMFAFAIREGDRLYLARDIAGEKPLYYTEKPFRFASENKALDFQGKEFPPAHYGIYENGKLTIKRWWTFEPHHINLKTAQEELEWLLEDSIRLRTQSDVPYGLFLSKGVDSTLISSFHDFQHTFTYEDGDYKDEFLRTFQKILWHLDGPVQSFSPFGLWKLSEQARDAGVKVILSGEGADELFGGYVRFIPPSLAREARLRYPSYKAMFPGANNVNNLGWREFNGNMRELLRMGDRMTSAFGIENRCPFLDKRIIEFAFSLPHEAKIQGFDTKILLNKVLMKRRPDYIPVEKHGLYCSVNKWIGTGDKFGKELYTRYQHRLWRDLQLSSPHTTTTN